MHAVTREAVHEKTAICTFLPGKKDGVMDGVKKVKKYTVYTVNDFLRHLHVKKIQMQ